MLTVQLWNREMVLSDAQIEGLKLYISENLRRWGGQQSVSYLIQCIRTDMRMKFPTRNNDAMAVFEALGYTIVDQGRKKLVQESEPGPRFTAEPVDITGVGHVHLQVRSDGKVVWVNIDGICALRISRIEGPIIIEDQRNADDDEIGGPHFDDEIEVLVQRPNKPDSRRSIGTVPAKADVQEAARLMGIQQWVSADCRSYKGKKRWLFCMM